MITYSALNPAQKKAVTSTNDHIRVVAGAGSGKTRVLTMRVAYLIEKLNVRPWHILAITFTNKAANEMRSRVKEMLGDEGNGTWISTIHSLCVRILHEDIEALNYPKTFTICDATDQKQILKEAYKELGITKQSLSYGNVLDYISNNKCIGITPSQAMELASGDPYQIQKAKAYAFYQKRLANLYALDFDDLILWTIRLFKENPEILEKWAKRFHYVLVDEFQDVDAQQYILIRQLAAYHDHLYVVGDPDQTIYTWRGADVNIIMGFDKDFPDVETIVLNENYRSTNNILNGANSVIQNNRLRVEKELFSRKGAGDKIIYRSLPGEDEESRQVADTIAKLHDEGYNYADMAILYRSNYLSRNVEKVLMERHIPYVIYGGLRFYERAEVKDILAYLRMIVTRDDLALIRTINTPKRGIGQKSIDQLSEAARNNGITIFELLEKGVELRHKEVFNAYVRMIHRWQEQLQNDDDLEKLFQMVLDDSGYRLMLENEKETEHLENIKSLMDDIRSYQRTYPEATLIDYLQNVALYTDKDADDNQDHINLLTVHSAKGLEFDVVFVIGLSEDIFPSHISLEEGLKGLEEERRLAYVAFTRAKEKLFLSDNTGYSYVTQTGKTRSRFVDEIAKDCLTIVNEAKPKRSSIFDEPMDIPVRKASPFRKGDIVEHATFKEGVVLDEKDGILEIAFAHPHGVKKILASHPSLKRKN